MKQINQLVAMTVIAVAGAGIAHGNEGHHEKAGKSAGHGHAATLGKPGDPKKVGRTVEITMDDSMRFRPASVEVKRGETVRFLLKNEGKLRHEMVLGTLAELKKHAELMARFPQMEHADPNQASVEPGRAGALVWQFTKAGTFDFACLQAGHYEAGMKGKIVVSRPAPGGAALTPVKADMLVAQAGVTDMTEGEVRKVDKEAGKLTLKHGEIKQLDMPPMTMVFSVKDKAMLDKLQPGDKVKFTAASEGGRFTITQIVPAN